MSSIKKIILLLTITFICEAGYWHDGLKNFEVKMSFQGLHLKGSKIHFKITKDDIGFVEAKVKDSREGDVKFYSMEPAGLMSFARSVLKVHKIIDKEIVVSKEILENCRDKMNLEIIHNDKNKKITVCVVGNKTPFIQQVVQWGNYLLQVAEEDRVRAEIPAKEEEKIKKN